MPYFPINGFILLAIILNLVSLSSADPTISQELYTSFQRYTNFSAASYASDCPIPPYGASVAQYFSDSTTDTQATLFEDTAAQEFILAFRGTSDVEDLLRDLNASLTPYSSVGIVCSDCDVHQGYLAAWNSVSSTIISLLRTQMSANPSYTLTVTGHSLGASLAALASASLSGEGFNFTTYTFGQPRTGNPAWANLIDTILPVGKLFRVTHANDGVPQTDTVAGGYFHHKTEYWEKDATDNDANNTYVCVGDEPPECNNSELGIGIGPGGLGINAAHLFYSNIVIANPLDGGATACSG